MEIRLGIPGKFIDIKPEQGAVKIQVYTLAVAASVVLPAAVSSRDVEVSVVAKVHIGAEVKAVRFELLDEH